MILLGLITQNNGKNAFECPMFITITATLPRNQNMLKFSTNYENQVKRIYLRQMYGDDDNLIK